MISWCDYVNKACVVGTALSHHGHTPDHVIPVSSTRSLQPPSSPSGQHSPRPTSSPGRQHSPRPTHLDLTTSPGKHGARRLIDNNSSINNKPGRKKQRSHNAEHMDIDGIDDDNSGLDVEQNSTKVTSPRLKDKKPSTVPVPVSGSQAGSRKGKMTLEETVQMLRQSSANKYKNLGQPATTSTSPSRSERSSRLSSRSNTPNASPVKQLNLLTPSSEASSLDMPGRGVALCLKLY